MSNKKVDIIIVGGGIVGLATAYKLQLKFPKKSILVLEKENEFGKHQTGRNSGVIHSGIYYEPGSYKAKNCKSGRDQLVRFAQDNNLPFDICGKIIVATNEEEIEMLNAIFEKGRLNGTEGIRFLSSEEIKEKEPYIDGMKAIWVPTAGIIDYVAVSRMFVSKMNNINAASNLVLSCKVQDVFSFDNISAVKTNKGEYQASKILFCTGLHSDRNAKRDDLSPNMKIVGFRGDYYELVPESTFKIKNLVYPVPNPQFPFLGVHFTRMIHGGIECGPNAVFSFKREGYKRTSFSLIDTYEALAYRGTWKLFRRHWREGIKEYKRAFSKRLFVKELQRMMPSISMDDVQPARAGVRAQALDAEGYMVNDFKIMKANGNIHVLNAPSPAATSCLAVADEILNVF
jgi:L-2-hydroxyglutarate oxidase